MKISIIIPIYNIEDCLERCVKSVCAQTYRDLEIILVDDGSTDGTPALVEKLAAEDSRIIAFHKPNGGSSSARNYGIRYATGDYLGFVDSDDFVSLDMYEKLAETAQKNNLGIVQICRDEIDSTGSRRPFVVEPPDAYQEIGYKDFLKSLLLHQGDCSFCTKLVKRELFDIALFPEGELNEDFWLLVQMLSACDAEGNPLVDRIGVLPDIGYHVYYRETSNSRTTDRNRFPRVFTDIVVNADRMEKLVSARFPELIPYAERFALVQRLDYLLHIPVPMMNSSNAFYMQVKEYLRSHRTSINNNPFLNTDQKKKLKLLAVNPRLIRWIHLKKMQLFRQI